LFETKAKTVMMPPHGTPNPSPHTVNLGDTNRDHLDGSHGVVVAGRNLGDLFHKIIALNDLQGEETV
jgi:ribulose-5-phosphate 4-epimerase/fuculose-1-phosphate aldolase